MYSDVLASGDERPRTAAKIKTIVFDLGGVLFTEGKTVALEALARDYDYDPAVVWDVLTCPRSRDMRKGLVSEADFWAWAERRLPPNYSARVIRDAWYEGYALDREIFELVKGLQGRYRLVVFSENIPDRVAYLDERYGFRELFDVEIYSYDHQAGKRDPRFLEILLATLGQRPGEILYIDNSRDVLERAERQGVNVALYTTGQTKEIEAAMRRLDIAV